MTRLDVLVEELKTVDMALCVLKKEYEFKISPVKLHKEDVEEELKKEIAKSFGIEDVTLGSWGCPGGSPTNKCVYDVEDTEEDFCLYCGEPDERK